MNPVEKAVFSLTRAILGNKKARTAFILYACALHLLVMYTTWECALSGSSQDQFQRQRNPFVRPLSALTILGLLNHFLLVMIRLLLYMRIVFGYYTLHNIIYTALHAPVITTRTPNQVSPLPWCLRVRRPPSSDPVTLESQRLVYCIEHRLHRLSYICQHELSSQNFHAH